MRATILTSALVALSVTMTLAAPALSRDVSGTYLAVDTDAAYEKSSAARRSDADAAYEKSSDRRSDADAAYQKSSSARRSDADAAYEKSSD